MTGGPTERNTGARAPLSRPRIYWAFQVLAGAPRRQAIFVGDYVRPEPGSEVLDLGCGSEEMVRLMDGAGYLGLDVNAGLHLGRAQTVRASG